MAMSKRLQEKIRRAEADIKSAKLEIRKMKVQLKKGKQRHKRLESGMATLTKRLREATNRPYHR
nr:hypothetical protein Hi04_10k_c4606_00013 [uncultured bacterium]